MNVDKFIDLIERSCLYFSLKSQLKDPDEAKIYASLQKKLDLVHPSNREFLDGAFKVHSTGALLNCWHQNTGESAKMWKEYTNVPEGVVVRSSISRIKDALSIEPRSVQIATISYIDYDDESHYSAVGETQTYNMLEPLVCKGKRDFADEKEVRLLILGGGISVPFAEIDHYVKVKLTTLVEEVILSPTYRDTKIDLIKELVKHKLGIDFQRSVLTC